MTTLRRPLAARALGGAAGALAAVLARLLARLPDRILARLAALVAWALGDTVAGRAARDLCTIFAAGGPDARVVRRILGESRREEIAGIVRSAVIRRLT